MGSVLQYMIAHQSERLLRKLTWSFPLLAEDDGFKRDSSRGRSSRLVRRTGGVLSLLYGQGAVVAVINPAASTGTVYIWGRSPSEHGDRRGPS